MNKSIRRDRVQRLLVEFIRPQAAYLHEQHTDLNKAFWDEHIAEVRHQLGVKADEWRQLTNYKIVPIVSVVQPLICNGHQCRHVGAVAFDNLPEILHQTFRSPEVRLLGPHAPYQPAPDMRHFVMTFESPQGPVAWIKNMECFSSGSGMADRCEGNSYIWREIIEDGTEFAADADKVLRGCQTIDAFHDLVPEAIGDFSEKVNGATLPDASDELLRVRMRLHRSHWKEKQLE